MTACGPSAAKKVIQAEAYTKAPAPDIPPLASGIAAPCPLSSSVLKGPDPRDDLRAVVGLYGSCAAKHGKAVAAYNRVRSKFGRASK